MSGESEEALRNRAVRLRRALAEAAERQNDRLVALYAVDLEDVERTCRARGIDLAAPRGRRPVEREADRPPLAHLVDLPHGPALELLSQVSTGRLLPAAQVQPAVQVLGHLLDDGQLILRLHLSAGSPVYPDRLTYRVEHIDVDELTGWVVTVAGRAEQITDPAEQARFCVPLWARPDERNEHLLRIRPEDVTGHSLTRDHTPDE
ncbi:pyridoxamine 5'-phosphate oxidase family protein [Kitasatospora sp. NPDC059571]|uniref:pyridoxamine 5'-phosphate oxidase family protein n=1 Tax=Kitasatospora sp. NPDC059571 TaxID=3346871 RepID=UPI0036C2CA3F